MQDKQILLVLLCGLPGAGKTTISKYIKQCVDNNTIQNKIIQNFDANTTQISFHHICYDSYLFKKLNINQDNNDDNKIEFNNELWKKSRNEAFVETESLIIDHITNNINCNIYSLLFIDDNMFYRSMRYKYYKLSKKYGTGFVIIYLNTNQNECIQRNNKRKGIQFVNKAVIQRMNKNFQTPNLNKYSWETSNCFTFKKITVNNDNNDNNNDGIYDNYNLDDLYKMISESWTKIPLKNKIIDVNLQNKTRKINLNSLKHQSDIKLRKLMGSWMKIFKQNINNVNKTLKEISTTISVFRKDILKDITNCIIDDHLELDLMIEGVEQQFNQTVEQYFLLLGGKL